MVYLYSSWCNCIAADCCLTALSLGSTAQNQQHYLCSRCCTCSRCPRGGGTASTLPPLPWKRAAGERASPLPGAHVAADIRGAAPGRKSAPPLAVVCVEASGEQAGKKLFSEARRPLRLVHLLLKRFSWIMHPGEEETFLPWTQPLGFVISALQHRAQFPDISSVLLLEDFLLCICWDFFFSSALPVDYLSELEHHLPKNPAATTRTWRHLDNKVRVQSCLLLHLFWETLLFPVYCKWNARTVENNCSCD